MTEIKTKHRSDLDRLATSLVDDILNMSDEELLAEVKADGEDPKQIAEVARGILERARTTSGKSKLAAARKAVLSARKQVSLVSSLDPSNARKKLETVLAQYPETHSKLTLAARKGEGLSDEDVRGMLEDFEELGITLPNNEQDGTE